MDILKIESSLYDYQVEVTESFEEKLEEFVSQNSVAFVIDRNVFELYKNNFLNAKIDESKVYFVDAVESKKNINTVLDLIYFWKSIGLKKNWKVLCFGGGITQDITTFAANIFLRNIDWYFFPTTLLAMSDSCIGGKCGINLDEFKNQLGVFYPPKKIFICDKFLRTLPEADWLNGWGEILKFSLTETKEFYDELKHEKIFIPSTKISYYIHKGLVVKKNIIEQDEFEGNLRRILNYGHTFGHALEAYTHNEIPHGKAVIWGIDVVNYIAYRENILDKNIYLDVKALIKNAFLKTEIKIENPDALISIVKTDKKVRDDTIFLALLDKLSHLIIYPMSIDEKFASYFCSYLEETNEYYRA